MLLVTQCSYALDFSGDDPIPVSDFEKMWVEVRTYKKGRLPSEGRVQFIPLIKVGPPEFKYDDQTNKIQITSGTTNATVFYTDDGTDPTPWGKGEKPVNKATKECDIEGFQLPVVARPAGAVLCLVALVCESHAVTGKMIIRTQQLTVFVALQLCLQPQRVEGRALILLLFAALLADGTKATVLFKAMAYIEVVDEVTGQLLGHSTSAVVTHKIPVEPCAKPVVVFDRMTGNVKITTTDGATILWTHNVVSDGVREGPENFSDIIERLPRKANDLIAQGKSKNYWKDHWCAYNHSGASHTNELPRGGTSEACSKCTAGHVTHNDFLRDRLHIQAVAFKDGFAISEVADIDFKPEECKMPTIEIDYIVGTIDISTATSDAKLLWTYGYDEVADPDVDHVELSEVPDQGADPDVDHVEERRESPEDDKLWLGRKTRQYQNSGQCFGLKFSWKVAETITMKARATKDYCIPSKVKVEKCLLQRCQVPNARQHLVKESCSHDLGHLEFMSETAGVTFHYVVTCDAGCLHRACFQHGLVKGQQQAHPVKVLQTRHSAFGDNGRQFFFNASDWMLAFGKGPVGMHSVTVERDAKQIWEGDVRTYDDADGVYGRRHSSVADDDWQVGDIIRAVEHDPHGHCGSDPSRDERIKTACDHNVAQSVSTTSVESRIVGAMTRADAEDLLLQCGLAAGDYVVRESRGRQVLTLTTGSNFFHNMLTPVDGDGNDILVSNHVFEDSSTGGHYAELDRSGGAANQEVGCVDPFTLAVPPAPSPVCAAVVVVVVCGGVVCPVFVSCARALHG